MGSVAGCRGGEEAGGGEVSQWRRDGRGAQWGPRVDGSGSGVESGSCPALCAALGGTSGPRTRRARAEQLSQPGRRVRSAGTGSGEPAPRSSPGSTGRIEGNLGGEPRSAEDRMSVECPTDLPSGPPRDAGCWHPRTQARVSGSAGRCLPCRPEGLPGAHKTPRDLHSLRPAPS